ncbi:MAG: hypothetical protein IAF38_22115, partial [Bacteroidia bacterium]|nr:hypothetical protein [Bacteroidia bacterium]
MEKIRLPILGKLFYCFSFFLLWHPDLFCQADTVVESVASVNINRSLNFIQFYDRDALKRFYSVWKQEGKKEISIVHLGDSHVQPDIYSGELRKRMQQIHGQGGQGMIFPYSAAKTYSSLEYKSSHKGKWVSARSLSPSPKLILGVSGATIQTEDPNASFTINFVNAIPDDYRKLKIFCKRSKECYDFEIECGGKTIFNYAEPAYGFKVPFIEIILPAKGNSITLKLKKGNPYQHTFEFYGMSLESTNESGLIVHAVGIGGAKFNALLHQKLLTTQIPELKPDLIILDYGTNDFLYDDVIQPEFASEIKRAIDSIRRVAPDASILLTSTQDMYFKGKNVYSSVIFSEMIKKIAKEKNCAFYDWFWISGGLKSMKAWQENGFAQKDFIHLNMKGYRLKGELLSDAIIGTMNWLDQHSENVS